MTQASITARISAVIIFSWQLRRSSRLLRQLSRVVRTWDSPRCTRRNWHQCVSLCIVVFGHLFRPVYRLGVSETPAIRLSTKDGKLLSYNGNFTSKVKITRWVSMNGVILLVSNLCLRLRLKNICKLQKKFDDSKLISVMNGSPALFFFHTAETMVFRHLNTGYASSALCCA